MSLRGAQFNAGHAGGGDGEVFLMLKEFQPALSRGGDMVMDFLSPATRVLEVAGETAMRASLAKGMPVCVRFQNATQMRLAQDDDVVDTLTPDRSDQPFGETIVKSSQLHSYRLIGRKPSCLRMSFTPSTGASSSS